MAERQGILMSELCMINVIRTKNTDELSKVYALMQEYFKPHEIVPKREFVYYAQNYSKLHKGEDYIVYKIEDDTNDLIGMMSGVKLDEFVVIDYFIIDARHRRLSKEILNSVMMILMDFKRPIVIEAETEVLCRLYQMIGFKRFSEPYKYIRLDVNLEDNTSKVSSYDYNLMYLSSDEIDFETTKRTLYAKHYLRWNSIFGDELIKDYKKALGV
jgi:hypothetical protein